MTSLLAIHFPSLDLLFIFAFAGSLPVLFVLWIRWWLGSVKDENPEKMISEQNEADRDYIEHHAHGHDSSHGHGPDHGHGSSHGRGHHHAHA